MRQSKLFTKTSKTLPKDEVSVNSQLLLKSGFIDKEIAGVYSFLPMGYRVLDKIINIIREEMNAIDGQEIMLTALQSPQTWEPTDRWDDSKMDVWFKTELKNGSKLGLAPTHEEPLTKLMKKFITSYKDLPVYAYQFQTKFRNETRAKSGILRTREFIMKDLYSFCRNQQELDEYYEKAKAAYVRIFERLGLGDITYVTYASGGTFSKFSHEFQTLCEYGEDLIYINEEKKIAINREIFEDEILSEFGLTKADFVEKKAIEVGNIFKLGTKFSDGLGLQYVDENGERKNVIMGSYGIGPGRVMGTIVETHNDKNGIIWPKEVAPYQVHIVSLGKDEVVMQESEKLYNQLNQAGYEVLWDDRTNLGPGAKFADSDLIGCPIRITVSGKNIEKSQYEVKRRIGGDAEFIPQNDIEAFLDNELK
ncbi:MAG: prolyl-tRNA synthetase [Clostridiales bacterium]|jgi:prolyl-tRNA synthetase|nr:prolyl-tRNA synthetase [Clostridiales bacterium]MDN5281566.1 prolyl-tRNA synthetase [Candidatus Ozemobacter sp.]